MISSAAAAPLDFARPLQLNFVPDHVPAAAAPTAPLDFARPLPLEFVPVAVHKVPAAVPIVPVRMNILEETGPNAALDTASGCKDAAEVPCAMWAAQGECRRIPVYMLSPAKATVGLPVEPDAQTSGV